MHELSLKALRQEWAQAWGKAPHGTMGRTMMVESLKFKREEHEGGGLTPEQQARLYELVRSYKRKPDSFDNLVTNALACDLTLKLREG